jgi:Cu+-exporting ATPase
VIKLAASVGVSLAAPTEDTTTIKLRVGGMTCAACVGGVEKALSSVPGVIGVRVALLAGFATVDIDPTKATVQDLIEAVDDSGFDAEQMITLEPDESTIELQLGRGEILHSTYYDTVAPSLRDHPGVRSVEFIQDRAIVHVLYDRMVVGPRDLIRIITERGVVCELAQERGGQRVDDSESRTWGRLLGLGLLFTIPVVLIAMVIPMTDMQAMHALSTEVARGLTIQDLVLFILATPIQFVLGKRFYIGAYHALKRRNANMDVLIVGSTTSAYVYSVMSIVYAMAKPGFRSVQFFETSAMLITIVFLGKYLEAVAKYKTSEALRTLLDLQPGTAMLLEDGVETQEPTEISTALLHAGDLVKVLPGARIPCDGEVVTGRSHADESMVTGESRQVDKEAGSTVIGGSVNTTGSLTIRATCVGSNSMLNQIVKLVGDAQSSKAPIEAFADKVSGRFVPAVVAIAVVVFAAWMVVGHTVLPSSWLPKETSPFLLSFTFFITTLVIACPCALGLAAPTAVMVGTGVGARLGVLIKGGAAIEGLSRVDTVVFDKTGTLTDPVPTVAEFAPVNGHRLKVEEHLRLLAASESESEHPFGKVIHLYATERLRSDEGSDAVESCTDYVALPGLGLECKVGGSILWVGNAPLMRRIGAAVSADVHSALQAHGARGETAVLLAVADLDDHGHGPARVEALVAVASKVRPEAASVVHRLLANGCKVVMLTGDNEATAAAVARQVGITNVFANVLPGDKCIKVQELQANGCIVAMVGDGINDSPALAQADVGVAIGAGADVAIEAAEVVLTRSDLRDLVVAIDLARKTFSRIRANFFWALVYNCVMIPVAAGVLFPLTHPDILPPWACGIAMALSSVSVVLSSLQLKMYRPPRQSDLRQSKSEAVVSKNKQPPGNASGGPRSDPALQPLINVHPLDYGSA